MRVVLYYESDVHKLDQVIEILQVTYESRSEVREQAGGGRGGGGEGQRSNGRLSTHHCLCVAWKARGAARALRWSLGASSAAVVGGAQGVSQQDFAQPTPERRLQGLCLQGLCLHALGACKGVMDAYATG